MNDTAYTYAVARIRANEPGLLTAADIEQLVAVDGAQPVLRFLEDKGWIDPEKRESLDAVFRHQAEKAWRLLTEIAPDIGELEFLIVRNDFHNIKAALKAYVADREKTDSFIWPSLIEPEQIRTAIGNKEFDTIPGFAKEAIQKTYEILVRTMDGQLADIILDAMALNEMQAMAKKAGSPFVEELVELFCVAADIKIAFRAAKTGKDSAFLDTALCATKTLVKTDLIEAARKGVEEFILYLSNTVYREAAEQIRISTTAFEKWCDDILMAHVLKAKYVSFAIDPLVAYYIAKESEIKTVRMILSCKYNAIPTETIRERVRRIYA